MCSWGKCANCQMCTSRGAGVEWDWGVAPLVSGRVAGANLCPLLYLFTQPFIPANATRSINFDTFINQHFPQLHFSHINFLPPVKQKSTHGLALTHDSELTLPSCLSPLFAGGANGSKPARPRQGHLAQHQSTSSQPSNVGLLDFWWMQEAAEQRQ